MPPFLPATSPSTRLWPVYSPSILSPVPFCLPSRLVTLISFSLAVSRQPHLSEKSTSQTLLTVSSYALSLVNTLVSFGLLLLYMPWYRSWKWDPPFQAPKVVIVLFFLSNFFLVTVPFFPPASGSKTYDRLPYWVSNGTQSRKLSR